jgi:hypothetical protein
MIRRCVDLPSFIIVLAPAPARLMADSPKNDQEHEHDIVAAAYDRRLA